MIYCIPRDTRKVKMVKIEFIYMTTLVDIYVFVGVGDVSKGVRLRSTFVANIGSNKLLKYTLLLPFRILYVNNRTNKVRIV